MVYESKAVIESPTRSPDSTGRTLSGDLLGHTFHGVDMITLLCLCKMRRLSHPLPGKNEKLLGKT
jgi:hypothetical protein